MKILGTIMILIALAVATSAVALAHGDREDGDLNLVVGFLNEPAYEGELNAASVRVTRVDDSGGASHSSEEGVEGLERTLQIEITHVPTSISKTMNLRAAFGDPGHYIADIVPTAPGHYRFRVFGTIEGDAIDETFDSHAGGGDFDDVVSMAGLYFPEPQPSMRELESAARGAQEMAREAQIAASAASEESDSGAGALMGIIGIVVGAVGVAVGAAAMVVAIRAKNS